MERKRDLMDNYSSEAVFEKPKLSKGKKILIFVLVVLLVLASYTCVNIFVVNRNFTVSFYQIRSEKVSDNIRIVELADLHNAEFGKNNSKLIAKIKDLEPDLIFYAGDMMNYRNDDYSVLFDLSDKLGKIAPIYACYGNNELDQYLFEDKHFSNEYCKHSVNLLSNEAVDVKVKNTTLQLVAISDDSEQYDVKTNNGKKFIESLEPTNNCRVCLTHYPELFHKQLLDKGIDVAFTGHAHGGLIRLPYIGGLYSTGEGFLPHFTSGVEEREDGTQVVVSRGLGNSKVIPRLNNQPELVVVDICWY